MLQPSEKISRILGGLGTASKAAPPQPASSDKFNIINALLAGTRENQQTETVEGKKKKSKLKKKAQSKSWLSLRHYAMDILDKGIAKDTHPMIRRAMFQRFLNK